MADTIKQTIELSVQLLTADGTKSKLIKIPDPDTSNLGGRSGVISKLAPLVSDYQYQGDEEPMQIHDMQGIFAEYYNGKWNPYIDFGTIEVTSKTVTKLG